MSKEQKPSGMRAAIIGLIGTLLTVCGGVTGALVTNAATIYSLEMESKRVDLKNYEGDKTLKVNAGETFITRKEAAALDPADYYVNLEQAFVMHRPLDGWDEMEAMTLGEQLAEENVNCLAMCNEAVYRLRYGEPIMVVSDRASTINGDPIAEELLEASELLYGPPPWNIPYYNQLILNIFDRKAVQGLGIESLPDLLILMTSSYLERITMLVAPEGSHFAIVQSTSTYGGIRVDGQEAQMTVDSWLYLAEAKDAFYMIEIRYTAQSGESIQVWDDLQYYIDQFRVIQD